ncbi:hypothetical protein ACKWTF_013036 [Chironomus riparius]
MPSKHQQPLPKRNNLDMSKDDKENKEVSNFEIFQLIEKMRAENKQGINSLKNELGTKISEIQLLLSHMQQRIDGMETKIQQANAKADEALKLAYKNKTALNMISQNLLQKRMEISGSNIDVTLKGDDLTTKIKELIESFGVTVKDHELIQTFQRTRNQPVLQTPVVVVEFKNLDTKLKVLKARKTAIGSKIYFDNCLTPLNRFLMYKAREVAKEKNFRVFLSGDQVHVKKDNDTNLIINDICDVDKIKSWIPNLRV